MKRLLPWTYAGICALLMGTALTSCKGKKEADPPKGETEIVLPCSEYKSDKKHFRVFSFGESKDANVAKKKALSNAKAELAGMVSSVMKVVGDNYVKSSEFNNTEELLERFEENARTVVNQKLKNVTPVCDRLMEVSATKNFKYYVALEMAVDDVADDYYKALSDDENLKIDYNYEKFKETFKEEMQKMGS